MILILSGLCRVDFTISSPSFLDQGWGFACAKPRQKKPSGFFCTFSKHTLGFKRAYKARPLHNSGPHGPDLLAQRLFFHLTWRLMLPPAGKTGAGHLSPSLMPAPSRRRAFCQISQKPGGFKPLGPSPVWASPAHRHFPDAQVFRGYYILKHFVKRFLKKKFFFLSFFWRLENTPLMPRFRKGLRRAPFQSHLRLSQNFSSWDKLVSEDFPVNPGFRYPANNIAISCHFVKRKFGNSAKK